MGGTLMHGTIELRRRRGVEELLKVVADPNDKWVPEVVRHCVSVRVPVFCSNIITHMSLGTALLMVALVLHGNISAISGNVGAISRVCGGMRALG